MNSDEIQKMIYMEFPENQLIVENCKYRSARLRLEVKQCHLRPGRTVSGHAIMLIANLSIYTSILSTMGENFYSCN